MKITRKCKLFACILMAMVLLLGDASSAFAANSIIKGYGNTYGSSFDDQLWGIYKYYLYKCQTPGNIIYTGEFLTLPMNHICGRAAQTNGGVGTVEISWDSTKSWNNSIGADIGLKGLVSLTAESGYGVSSGWSVTASYAKSVSLDEQNIKYASSGVYAIAAGMPNYKIKWEKINWLTGKKVDYDYFYMPYGHMTTYVVRSLDNQQSWLVYQ